MHCFFCTDGKSSCRVNSLKREQLQMPFWQAPRLMLAMWQICTRQIYYTVLIFSCAVLFTAWFPGSHWSFSQLVLQFLKRHDSSIFNCFAPRLLWLYCLLLFCAWVASALRCAVTEQECSSWVFLALKAAATRLTWSCTDFVLTYIYQSIHFKACRAKQTHFSWAVQLLHHHERACLTDTMYG